MSKIAVVYWSGTGNTEAMAHAVVEGAKEKGNEVDLFKCSEFDVASVYNYNALAFGCPSMGTEQLEESEFEPMFASVEESLVGKKDGLFGKWGWGNSAWMFEWEERTRSKGAELVPSVTCMEAPDDAAITECKNLGASL